MANLSCCLVDTTFTTGVDFINLQFCKYVLGKALCTQKGIKFYPKPTDVKNVCYIAVADTFDSPCRSYDGNYE
jgi:hypothetical protein